MIFFLDCRHVLYRRPLARPSDERRKADKNVIYHGSGNVCGVFRQYLVKGVKETEPKFVQIKKQQYKGAVK